jgi:hypothetical protein
MERKICEKCGTEKEYIGRCKECRRNYQKSYFQDNRERIYKIKNEWSKNNKEKVKESYNKFKQNNPSKIKEYAKRTYEKNKDKKLKYCKEYTIKNKNKKDNWGKIWREKNKERINIQRNKRNRERRQVDENYRLITNITNRMRSYLKNYNTNERTIKYIGCSPLELRKHLESQFTEGMSWENYGKHGWHIDHKIPLFAGKGDKNQIIKLCHYTNLQPLWEKDNYKKWKRIV